jgi:hypothetical protein
MPLRRTQRSDGRQRPRWKDGSHVTVESTHANESRCDGIALEPNRQTEPLVTVPPLLERSHENKVSTRDRPAKTGADARIEESAAMGEVRLALRPYGRRLSATRLCWSIGIGGCDDSMKFRSSSSGWESRPARGEPARAGSEPGDGLGNEIGEA